MKQRIVYNIGIVALGALELFFAVMLIFSLVPPANSFGIEVRETLTVSSSVLDADKGRYVSQLSGILITTGDTDLDLDAIRVTVSNGAETKEILLKDVKLPSRLEQELFYEWEDTRMYDRVLYVEVNAGEKSELLSNSTAGMVFDLGVLLWLVLGVVDGIFLTHVIKQRYYLAQEISMNAKTEA